jgi:acyl-CoA synthetase (AMP-forming)/AMP-acid ligase II
MLADNLASGFFRSAQRFADRPALVVADQELTYCELAAKAVTIASAFRRYAADRDPLAAILASRSVTAYAGILGILASGKGYVPLNPRFPIERTRKMLELSGASVLVVDRESLPLLPKLLSVIDRALTVVAPEIADAGDLATAFRRHRFVGSGQLSTRHHFTFPRTVITRPWPTFCSRRARPASRRECRSARGTCARTFTTSGHGMTSTNTTGARRNSSSHSI